MNKIGAFYGDHEEIIVGAIKVTPRAIETEFELHSSEINCHLD